MPAINNPVCDERWDDPAGVVIDAFIFGGRRATTVPLVTEARTWAEGVYMAATMGSETTAAAFGKLGVVRRDPFAMLPFCGYNMSDYFQHWLDMEKKVTAPPKIFCVNWFRRDAEKNFLWPGYGENMRVLQWILGRVEGTAGCGPDHVFGVSPRYEDMNLKGLSMSKAAFEEAIKVVDEEWRAELLAHEEHFQLLAHRLPTKLSQLRSQYADRVGSS